MKKLLLTLAMAFTLATAASAKDTYAHDGSVLPQAAQTTIAQNCEATVSVVKIESDFGRVKEYEVILTDGTEISFDRNGNWENVETNRGTAVPASFVPSPVAQYVSTKHPGAVIVGIERDRKGYEVELSTGIDMKFSPAGQFLRYDD